MSTSLLILLTLFTPVGAALTLGLLPNFRRAGRPAEYLSVAAAFVSLIAATVLFIRQQLVSDATPLLDTHIRWLSHNGKSLVEVGATIDGISAPMLLVVALVAFCVQLYSMGYLAGESGDARGRYFTYQSLFIFAMEAMVVAPNAFQVFMGWELVGMCSYLLIGHYYQKPSAARASLKAFWVTKFADMGLLFGLLVLFTVGGSFGWDSTTVTSLGSSGATAVAALFLLAVVGKSAQFPLHIWLPDAMEGPTPVSALLHAATMVAAGVYLIVRTYPIFAAAPDVLTVMAYLGAFTAFFAACVAMVQTDIKKLLAYSTCSQLGYMVAALGTGSLMGGYFHLSTHACFKALLFLAAGSFIHAVHSNEMENMGGLWAKMKLSAILFIIGSLALAGLPGLSGFFSKEVILEELSHSGHALPFVACMLTAGMTAFYMTKACLLAIFGPPSEGARHAHESPKTMLLPMGILAALSLVAGFGGTMLAQMYGVEYAFHFGTTGIIATALGFAGIGLALFAYLPSRRANNPFGALTSVGSFIRYGAVDRTAAFAYRNGLCKIGAAIGWFDRYVVDGVMNLTGWLPLVAAQRLRRIQTGVVTDYVYGVIVGLIVLIAMGTVFK
ncbi:MAG: NADH-quinone oxidoreductase subunit L [Myxococcota bacterium]|nr:NADH-quinone oxidoreductase subunit L [Myxococcota bacterium]